MGKLQFDFLLSQGLTPQDVFLDVACGSLRAGVKLIPFLDKGNYLGIEAEPDLLRDGVEKELGPALERLKKPELVASRAFEFDRFSKRPTYGIAQSLFTHLNVHDIQLCLGNLADFAAPGMKFFVTFFVGDSSRNPELSFNAGRFNYTPEEMAEFGDEFGFATKFIGDWGHPRNQNMFLYTAP
jgi:SAM-dependent methyltransferase